MIVSNFELLVKRIATVPPATPTSISTVFRRVVQGYFLLVSNLETARSIRLSLRITISSATGNRVISSSNVQCFFDNGLVNNVPLTLTQILPVDPNFLQYNTQSFVLAPQQTGLVALLPNVGAFVATPNPDLEIRGYIELNQGRLSIFPLVTVPEAKVLVSPETRGTFLDNDYPTTVATNELDFDQIAYSLPIASGKGMNTVESVPLILLPALDILPAPLTLDLFKKILKEINPDAPDAEIETLATMAISLKEKPDFFEIVKKM